MRFISSFFSRESEVAGKRTCCGNSSSDRFTLIPTPIKKTVSVFDIFSISTSTPPTFFPATRMSFGHFISAGSCKVSRIASVIATVTAPISRHNWSDGILCFNRIVKSNPLYWGQCQALMERPLPRVCNSEKTTIPFLKSLPVSVFAISIVEVACSQDRTSLPTTFVFKPNMISSGINRSGWSVTLTGLSAR